MSVSFVLSPSLLQRFGYARSERMYIKSSGIFFVRGELNAGANIRAVFSQSLFERVPGTCKMSRKSKKIREKFRMGRTGPSRNHNMRVANSISNKGSVGIENNEFLKIPPHPDPRAIVLDIEGTTTPISFVTDVLFPYASSNVRNHLMSTFESEETQTDIVLLRRQVEEDIKEGIDGAQLIPSTNASKEEIVQALHANVIDMIKADRKVTALKELQGHIWRYGYLKDELRAEVFEDVPKAFHTWHASGIKVYIYSSGSREAQKQIFGNTQYGDLRYFLSGYFDTVTAGNKREARSYDEIFLSVGVDEPSQIVFATDVIQEAMAAELAGFRSLIVSRPGNAQLPPEHGFRTVTSLLEI